LLAFLDLFFPAFPVFFLAGFPDFFFFASFNFWLGAEDFFSALLFLLT
jgi:hypothetical protein